MIHTNNNTANTVGVVSADAARSSSISSSSSSSVTSVSPHTIGSVSASRDRSRSNSGTKCYKCGRGFDDHSTKYCGHCGTARELPILTNSETVRSDSHSASRKASTSNDHIESIESCPSSIIDRPSSVAQRAAMFERSSPANCFV